MYNHAQLTKRAYCCTFKRRVPVTRQRVNSMHYRALGMPAPIVAAPSIDKTSALCHIIRICQRCLRQQGQLVGGEQTRKRCRAEQALESLQGAYHMRLPHRAPKTHPLLSQESPKHSHTLAHIHTRVRSPLPPATLWHSGKDGVKKQKGGRTHA